MKKNFVIMTSINAPTEAVQEIAKLNEWQLIVAGDKKTPYDWKYDGVIYLSPDDQTATGYELAKLLPWNSYSRKLIGYLYAIEQGAEMSWDIDDDNIPYPGIQTPTLEGSFKTLSGQEYVNTYKYFTNDFVWPRGYPLRLILDDSKPTEQMTDASIGVWQFLADEEPDVDAIYRLTINKQIFFDKNEPIVLDEGTMCAFNSQHTFFRKELFPLLYLPTSVKFRFTDILRSMIAQPIMWLYGYKLGFGQATVIQKRNPHDFLVDFELETEAYLDTHKVPDIISPVLSPDKTPAQNLVLAYEALIAAGIVKEKEMEFLNGWISDLKKLGIE